MNQPTAAGRNPLIFIFVTRLIDAMGFGIVMPVLPKLLLSMGAPDIAAASRTGGFLFVTYAAMQFFFGPVMGNLSDQFGRRPVLLLAMFAYGVDCLLMGFAPTVGWLFVGRAIAGMAGAVYVPANAFVADVTPPEKRAHAFGIVSSAFGLGFILGPAIGGMLGELGARAPFFVAAALAGLNFVFGWAVLPESLPLSRRRKFSWRRANPLGAAKMFRHYPSVLLYALVAMAFMLGNNVYPSTWSFYMTAKFDWSTRMIGISLMVTGLAMAFAQATLTGRLSRRLGETGAAYVGMVTATILCVLYAFIAQPWLVFVYTTIGALQAVAYPALNAMMSKQIPADAQGELQGANALLMSVANVAGPLLMTQTLAHFTASDAPIYFPGAAFLLAAVINAIGLTLLFVTVTNARRSSPSPSTSN